MDKSHNLTLYMERAERSLKLIKFKAPTAIVANDIRLVRESASLLEDMAGDEWQEVINKAHDDLLAHKESLQGEGDIVSCCCAAEILDLDICSQCREHCEPIEEGKDED